MLTKEQQDWLGKLVSGAAAALTGTAEAAPAQAGAGDGLMLGVVANAAAPAGPASSAAPAKHADSKAAKPGAQAGAKAGAKVGAPQAGAKAGGGKLTYLDVSALVDNLVYLARPEFRRATGKAGPAKLNLSATPAIAAPLEKAGDAVRLWADPKTVAQAAASWRAAEPGLRALLQEAASGPLKVDAATLKPGYDAIAAIVEWLSATNVDASIQAEQGKMETPRLSAELDKGEFAKLEPLIQAWQKVVGTSSEIVKGKDVDTLRQVIAAWTSSRDYEARMRALEKLGALGGGGKMGTLDVADLGSKIAHMAISAAVEINEQGVVLASMQAKMGVAEAEEAVHALEGRGKLLKGVGGIASAVGFAASTYELVEGIRHKDWKKIASGSFGIAMGGVAMAAEESAGGLLAGIEVTVWATAKAVLMGAEMARWFHKEQELDAFKRMAHDARALIPNGMEMTAAWNLLVQGQDNPSGESLTANDRARYEQIAKADGVKLGHGLVALLDNHFHKSDKNAIGGYPELVAPALPILRPAYAGIDYDNPGTLVDAFEATVKAVQAIMDAEAKSNPNAKPAEQAEE